MLRLPVQLRFGSCLAEFLPAGPKIFPGDRRRPAAFGSQLSVFSGETNAIFVVPRELIH